MRETKLPPNVVFCFNADEETGRCNGAKEVVQCLNLLHRKAIYIALDVTYEAYHTNKLYTVENCSFLERNRKTFIQKLYDIDDAFSYVPVGKKDTKLSYVKPSERAFGISWFDEGAAYGKQRKNAFSLCIPCGDGEMHSNIGVKVQQPVFEGYINSLGCVIAKLARDNQLLETLKKERSYIKEQLRNLPEKPVRTFRYDYPEDDLYGQYSFMDCSEFGYVPFSSKDMEDYEEWRMQIKEYFTMQASMYETDEFENFLAELNVPEKYIGYFTDSGDMEHMDGEEYYEALMFLEECFADTHPEYQSDIDYDVLLEEIS